MDEWANDSMEANTIASNILYRYKPYEPEMVLQLCAQRYRQWDVGTVHRGRRDFRVPLPDAEVMPAIIKAYEMCTWAEEGYDPMEYASDFEDDAGPDDDPNAANTHKPQTTTNTHVGKPPMAPRTPGNTSTAPSMARATTADTQRQGETDTQGLTTGNTSTAPSMARAGNADSQYQRETNRKGHRPTHLSGHDTGGAERDTLTKHNARGETTTNKRRLSLDPQENAAKKTNNGTTHQPKKTTMNSLR